MIRVLLSHPMSRMEYKRRENLEGLHYAPVPRSHHTAEMIHLTLALLLIASCAASPLGDLRIVGGNDAEVGQFPYQVSLRSTQNRHFCGGSILNERWVITAAHCVQNALPENVRVATGTVTVTEGENYSVEKIIVHEKYDGSYIRNDIALLKISKEITMSDTVKSIALATASPNARSKAVASGWGLTRVEQPQTVPTNLQFIELNILTNEDCRWKMIATGASSLIYSGNICTLNKSGEGMCMGDSGGPLVANNELIGLVSWGIPCARGNPDVFTRVSEFNGWVMDKLAKY